jgi:hypothetical protein
MPSSQSGTVKGCLIIRTHTEGPATKRHEKTQKAAESRSRPVQNASYPYDEILLLFAHFCAFRGDHVFGLESILFDWLTETIPVADARSANS